MNDLVIDDTIWDYHFCRAEPGDKERFMGSLSILGEYIMMCDEDYNNLISSIGESIFRIQDMAYREYRPIAYDLCSREANEEEVEYYLDRMVAFCGTDNMLNLFKMVCRRYCSLYPDLIAFEIQTYREMFDSEQET